MADNEPSFTPPNNPRGVSDEQRAKIEQYLAEGELPTGTPEGIDLMTFSDAAKLIMQVENRMKWRR